MHVWILCRIVFPLVARDSDHFLAAYTSGWWEFFWMCYEKQLGRLLRHLLRKKSGKKCGKKHIRLPITLSIVSSSLCHHLPPASFPASVALASIVGGTMAMGTYDKMRRLVIDNPHYSRPVNLLLLLCFLHCCRWSLLVEDNGDEARWWEMENGNW